MLNEIELSQYYEKAIQRTMDCMSLHFHRRELTPYNSNNYSIFLYYLSRIMYELDGNGENAEKIYYLNKILNSVELFYEITLPKHFGIEHPLGSIMGRASYGDYFYFYQGCTVGANLNKTPVLGNNIIMYANSKILGNSHIGNNVILAANASVIDTDIPEYSIVFGQARNLTVKKISEEQFIEHYNFHWRIDYE